MGICNNIIKTTVNMRSDRWTLLIARAEEKKITKQELMLLLIEKFIKILFENEEFYESAMCYQERSTSWKKPHITFSRSEFDRFLDVKKVFRLSLSHVLAMAIDHFDESEITDDFFDSYPKYSYKKGVFLEKGTRKYEFLWIEEGKTYKKPPI